MKELLIVVFMMSAQTLCAQQNLLELLPVKEDDNIMVEKLASDKHASCYVIWVKNNVKAHKHEIHTENIYILEGTGEMMLGDLSFIIKPGDFVNIPPNTIHSLKVTSEVPVKALSIQSPEFFGKDRVFID